MSYDYDLFVIGGGSGGVRAARFAGDLGARVALCEERFMGGTCVNIGCVPKKLFVYASQYSKVRADAAGYGWTFPSADFQWKTLKEHKDTEIERLNGVYDWLLDKAGVTVVRGRGVVTGPHSVRVGEETYTAERILVATGGRPFVPDMPGAELACVSDDMFALDELPATATIIGGGYIAVEFAGILHGLGVEVTLLERGARVLRAFDPDISACLQDEMAHQGIDVRIDISVHALERVGERIRCVLSDRTTHDTDLVLFATGRRPNTSGLFEGVDVELRNDGGIVVDPVTFESSVPSIHAVGDVSSRAQLTPVALEEGMFLAKRLYGGFDGVVSYENIPTAVFSSPECGTVGLTEPEARAAYDVDVYRSRFRPMKHTMTGRNTRMMMKLIVDRKTDRVLGCHMVGDGAGELVQGLGIAMTAGATKAHFDATVGIHPTAAEEFVTMRTPLEQS